MGGRVSLCRPHRSTPVRVGLSSRADIYVTDGQFKQTLLSLACQRNLQLIVQRNEQQIVRRNVLLHTTAIPNRFGCDPNYEMSLQRQFSSPLLVLCSDMTSEDGGCVCVCWGEGGGAAVETNLHLRDGVVKFYENNTTFVLEFQSFLILLRNTN